MKNIQDKELKRETIIAKFIKKLKMIENDHDVIDYNFYSDKSFAGVKIMRNKKITLDELAAIVIEGFAEQKNFNAEQRIINEEQKKFNEEQRKFNEEQKKFNEEQKKFNEEQKKYNKKIDRIEILVELMASTPTMKKELAELDKKK